MDSLVNKLSVIELEIIRHQLLYNTFRIQLFKS